MDTAVWLGRYSFPKLLGEEFRKIALHFTDIELALIPCSICGAQRVDVWSSGVADPFWHDFLSGEQAPFSNAQKVITRCPGGSTVTLNKWMHPIQPPETISSKLR